MKKLKKIQLSLHNSLHQDIEVPRNRRAVTSEILLVFKGAGYIAFVCCYYMGLGLLKITRLPLNFFGRRKRWLIISRARLRALSNTQFRFALLLFISLIGITIGAFRSAQFVSKAWELKAQILGATETGLGQMTAGEQLLKDQSVGLAGKRFAEAVTTFDQTQHELDSVGGFMNGLLNILPQKRDADSLIESVRALSKVGFTLTQFYGRAKELHFSADGITSAHGVEQTLASMNQDLDASLSDLALAQANLSHVSADSLPEDKRLLFTQAKDKVAIAQTSLSALSELLQVAGALSHGNKRVLLLSENNNELRASGGFIGTYGDIFLHSGSIASMKIASIYDLDGQLKEVITPPRPLWAVNNRWYMRDSNWFFDFPMSVKKITGFYEKEGGETPDFVLAITPTVMVDLLKITGPIPMPKYQTTLDGDNFIELTQLETSILYDKQVNQPKQMLADFTPLLLDKLSNLPAEQWPLVLEALQRNLAAKQILLYSRDPAIQDHFSSFNWSGEVRPTDRDYLAVVNSNLGGTKTDLTIDQSIALSSSIAKDGTITNTLTVTRTNPLPADPSLENLSFMRVYVPLGSTLIGTQGFSSVPLPDHLGADQKTDPDVFAWENSTVRHVLSDTLISQEAGKTVFGNWVKTAGQSHQTVTLTYQLPFKVAPLDHYSLLVQKQPGAVNQHFGYSLMIGPHTVAWKNFDANFSGAALNIPDTELTRDYFFGLVLDRNN